MKAAGQLLVVAALLIGTFGVLWGAYPALSSTAGGVSVPVIVGGILAAALLFGLGVALIGLQAIAEDARRSASAAERSADALEALAQRGRSTGAPARPAPPPAR